MRTRVLTGSLTALLFAATLLLQMAGCGGSGGNSFTQGPPPTYPDQLGTVNAEPLADCSSVGGSGGEPNGVCYNVTVTCPEIADITGVLKVNNPAGISKGTVTYTVGGGGEPFYDQGFVFGTTAIDLVVQAGFTTVQILFPNHPVGFPPGGTSAGWLTGPGGPRRLACRWVTIAHWVHDNIRQPNTPFCTTGNSAGAAVVGYALAHYNDEAIYNYVQETSGPPFPRIDHGCICNAPKVMTPCGQGLLSECYESNANRFVDPAYNPGPNSKKICSSAAQNHDTSNEQLFLYDSLASPDAKYSFPNVEMHFIFGGQDTGSAEPEAVGWQPLITTKTPLTTICVADAPHLIADVLDGAQAVANDMIASCK